MIEFVEWAKDWKATRRLPETHRKKGLPEKAPVPCASGGCKRFTGLGSNQHWTVRTCLDCGHGSRTEAVLEATLRYKVCPHLNANNRGSTNNTAIVFCKDCNNLVDVRSRDKAARSSKKAGQVKIASAEQQKLTARFLGW